MPSAVEQGLKAAARAGAKKAAEHAKDAKGLLRMDLQGGQVGDFHASVGIPVALVG